MIYLMKGTSKEEDLLLPLISHDMPTMPSACNSRCIKVRPWLLLPLLCYSVRIAVVDDHATAHTDQIHYVPHYGLLWGVLRVY